MPFSPGEDGIYLDHAATAPLRAEVWAAMAEAREDGYNPASPHAFGRRANRCLEEARARLAGLLGCRHGEVFFTGGGTQSDNLAILGFTRAHRGEDPRILTSAIEHKACLEAAARAAEAGARVERLPVDPEGVLELEALERSLREGDDAPTLVSVMWANNEVGTVQPVAEACELAQRYGAVFHTDAVQAFGKMSVSVDEVPADLLTITAHKLGGPVGIGLLVRRDGVDLEPLHFGGGQERALWPGTQNPLGACGFATAARLAAEEREEAAPRWRELRDRLEARLLERIPGARIHGAGAARRLPNLVSLGVEACDAATLLVSLDLESVAVSGGSACSSGSSRGSHVLEAMGVAADGAPYATVRFSFGHGTTAEEVDRAAEATARAATSAAGARP